MVLGPFHEVDLVPGRQRHDRLLPVGAAALVPAHPLHLSLEGGGADVGHLHVEHLLDRGADLDLVGVGMHAEGDRVVRFLLLHALLGHQRPDDDLARRSHRASASSSAVSAARSNTTCRACMSWYADTWPGVTTVSHGTLRAARRSGSPIALTTTRVRCGVTPSAVRPVTSDFVLPSAAASASTTVTMSSCARAVTAQRSASRRISRGM